MTTSHNISGFWFHITWKGNEGKDQRGARWINKENPEPKYAHSIKPLCEMYKNIVQLQSKKTA